LEFRRVLCRSPTGRFAPPGAARVPPRGAAGGRAGADLHLVRSRVAERAEGGPAIGAQIDEVVAGPVTACEACSSPELETVVDFLPQPPVQSFLTPAQLREPETHYPATLLRCSACGLVQLGYALDPAVVFPRDYPYQTGLTRIL